MVIRRGILQNKRNTSGDSRIFGILLHSQQKKFKIDRTIAHQTYPGRGKIRQKDKNDAEVHPISIENPLS